jgi:hypothetical protein
MNPFKELFLTANKKLPERLWHPKSTDRGHVPGWKKKHLGT